ncbi:MAG TPA: ROK family protein [Polyangiales bacterium]|jgi:fructokinase|nr:ROK family protein [Polyangiales bacterium]
MRIGIDLGGTKTELIALDAHREVYRKRVATPAHDYSLLVETLGTLVLEAERELRTMCSVGIATPGAVSAATGCIKNSNTQCMNGRPLHRDLATRLAREIRIENDANCFALSEAVDGAGQGADVVFGAILGTGVGGGVVVHQRVLHGRNAIGGEWGHNPLPWPNDDERPGFPCYCGKRGCIETFLSGPGLVQDFGHASGSHETAAGIVQRAQLGEGDAVRALERYYDRLARGLASVINVLDPDVIVLGGGVSNVDSLYSEVPPRLAKYVFSDRVDTHLARAQHGDSSGVRGAAWLWPE